MAEQRGNDFVQSLERGLSVIRAFDGEHPQLTLSDVSRRAGLTRGSVPVPAHVGRAWLRASRRS